MLPAAAFVGFLVGVSTSARTTVEFHPFHSYQSQFHQLHLQQHSSHFVLALVVAVDVEPISRLVPE